MANRNVFQETQINHGIWPSTEARPAELSSMALWKACRGTSCRASCGLSTAFFPLGISVPKHHPRVDRQTASTSVGERSNTCSAKFSEPSILHRDCPVLCTTGTASATDSKIRRERGIANTVILKHRYKNSPGASLKLAPEPFHPNGCTNPAAGYVASAGSDEATAAKRNNARKPQNAAVIDRRRTRTRVGLRGGRASRPPQTVDKVLAF